MFILKWLLIEEIDDNSVLLVFFVLGELYLITLLSKFFWSFFIRGLIENNLWDEIELISFVFSNLKKYPFKLLFIYDSITVNKKFSSSEIIWLFCIIEYLFFIVEFVLLKSIIFEPVFFSNKSVFLQLITLGFLNFLFNIFLLISNLFSIIVCSFSEAICKNSS